MLSASWVVLSDSHYERLYYCEKATADNVTEDSTSNILTNPLSNLLCLASSLFFSDMCQIRTQRTLDSEVQRLNHKMHLTFFKNTSLGLNVCTIQKEMPRPIIVTNFEMEKQGFCLTEMTCHHYVAQLHCAVHFFYFFSLRISLNKSFSVLLYQTPLLVDIQQHLERLEVSLSVKGWVWACIYCNGCGHAFQILYKNLRQYFWIDIWDSRPHNIQFQYNTIQCQYNFF